MVGRRPVLPEVLACIAGLARVCVIHLLVRFTGIVMFFYLSLNKQPKSDLKHSTRNQIHHFKCNAKLAGILNSVNYMYNISITFPAR